MSRLPADLLSLAEARHGILARSELQDGGLSRRQIDGLIARGVIERVGRQVYRVLGAPRTRRQLLLAACLDARGVATHRSAAALHGIGRFKADAPPEVLIHEARNTRSSLAKLRTTSTIDNRDIVVVDGIPTTTVARTLLSLASIAGPRRKRKEISERTFEDLFDEALAEGKVTEDELAEMLERCRRSGRGGVRLLERLLHERAEGQVSESQLERMTLVALREAGLELPECQQRIAPDGEFIARVDFIYPRHDAVIEVSGHRWHRSSAQMRRDTRRRRELTHLGLRVFEFTYRDVAPDPGQLVSTVKRILASKAGRERAGPVTWRPVP